MKNNIKKASLALALMASTTLLYMHSNKMESDFEKQPEVKEISLDTLTIREHANEGNFLKVVDVMKASSYNFEDVVYAVTEAYEQKVNIGARDIIDEYAANSELLDSSEFVSVIGQNPLVRLAADNGDFLLAQTAMKASSYNFEDVVYAVTEAYEQKINIGAIDIIDSYELSELSDSSALVTMLGQNPVIRLAADNGDFLLVEAAMEKLSYTDEDQSYVRKAAEKSGHDLDSLLDSKFIIDNNKTTELDGKKTPNIARKLSK